MTDEQIKEKLKDRYDIDNSEFNIFGEDIDLSTQNELATVSESDLFDEKKESVEGAASDQEKKKSEEELTDKEKRYKLYEQRYKRKRRIIFGAIAAAVLGLIIFVSVMAKNSRRGDMAYGIDMLQSYETYELYEKANLYSVLGFKEETANRNIEVKGVVCDPVDPYIYGTLTKNNNDTWNYPTSTLYLYYYITGSEDSVLKTEMEYSAEDKVDIFRIHVPKEMLIKGCNLKIDKAEGMDINANWDYIWFTNFKDTIRVPKEAFSKEYLTEYYEPFTYKKTLYYLTAADFGPRGSFVNFGYTDNGKNEDSEEDKFVNLANESELTVDGIVYTPMDVCAVEDYSGGVIKKELSVLFDSIPDDAKSIVFKVGDTQFVLK